MIHLGDITKLDGAKVPITDIVCGGSPCQDLSVAGKRAGIRHSALGDEETTRSGLFMEQVRLIKEMREHDRRSGRTDEHLRPRFCIWENVPGTLSSGTPKGADFQAVLEEFVKVVCEKIPSIPIPEKGWPNAGCISGVGDGGVPFSIAYRIHDAQWWGVAQRRKRISLLADFNGLSAGRILFDPQLERETEGADRDEAVVDTGTQPRSEVSALPQGVPGNPQSRRKARKGATPGTEDGAGSTGGCLNGWDVQSKHIQSTDGIAESLYSGECRYGGGESYVFDSDRTDGRADVTSSGFDGNMGARAGNIGYERERAPTLNAGKQMDVYVDNTTGYDWL